jgi:LPS export ABC transporter protein LptC
VGPWLSCGAVVFVVALVASCAARPTEMAPAARATPSPRPLLEIRTSRIVGTDPQGRRVWEVEAASVAVDEVQRQARLERPRGAFFAADGQTVRFAAAFGEYGADRQRIRLWGSVEVVAAPDRWLRAEQATYEARRLAARNVRFRWGRLLARADALEADVTLRRARLVGNVRLEAVEGR